jgi:hypothetical protein
MSAESNNKNGIGFLGMLTILFIGLKLTNYIEWSWWWVLSPIILIVIIQLFLGAILVYLMLKMNRDKKTK